MSSVSFDLFQPCHQTSPVLRFLGLSDSALPVVREFGRRSAHGEFEIRWLNMPDLETLLQGVRREGVAEAAFLPDDLGGCVACRSGLELGIAAPLLAHEMFHAIDGQYQQDRRAYDLAVAFLDAQFREVSQAVAVRTGLNSHDMTFDDCTTEEGTRLRSAKEDVIKVHSKMIFGAEKRAYQFQTSVVSELCSSVEGYQGFLRGHSTWGAHLLEDASDRQIIDRYVLDPRHAVAA